MILVQNEKRTPWFPFRRNTPRIMFDDHLVKNQALLDRL